MMPLPYDLDAASALAPLLIMALWILYGPLLNAFGRGTLNAQLHVVRLRWMRMMHDSPRHDRVFDAIILGQLSNSMSFFGSGTLLVVAGLVGGFTAIGGLHARLTQMAFFPPISLALFTFYFAVLTLIMVISFFSFVYALRRLAYTTAMVGGLTATSTADAHARTMIAETAMVLTVAVKSLNHGIRGFYFAIASLFLFISPWAAMGVAVVVAGVLVYRQVFSAEALAIEHYVIAMNAYEEERIGRGEDFT
jgi:uncharacterized membrane protein